MHKVAVALTIEDSKELRERAPLLNDATYIKTVRVQKADYRIFFWNEESNVDVNFIRDLVDGKKHSLVVVDDYSVYSDVQVDDKNGECDGTFKNLISWITRIYCPIDGDTLG